MNKTMEGFDPFKFAKQWHGIEHNIHQLKGECINTTDTFSKSGNVLTMTKTCRAKGGRESTEMGTVMIPDPNVRSKMIIQFKGLKGVLGGITYNVYDTDYDTYAIVGPNDGKSFKIMSTKDKMELCKLVELEIKASKLGFDISDTIKEYGTVIPCKGVSK